MPQFNYTVQDEAGRSQNGIIEASDEAGALTLLGQKYPLVTQLEPVESRVQAFLERLNRKSLNAEQKLSFTQQMAEMLDGGISLNQSLEIMIREAEERTLQGVAMDLAGQIQAGTPMAEALRRHPRSFDRFYTGMVEAGEASGQLPLMLQRLARYIERTEALKRQVRTAMVYPAVVITFAIIVVTLVLVLGVPRVAAFYRDLGGQLPLVTRVFINSCMFLANTWYIWLTGLLVTIVLGARWLRTEQGSSTLLHAALRVPQVGPLLRHIAVARFSRTLGTLYGSGISLDRALTLVATSMGNPELERSLLEARERLQNGESLSAAMRQSPYFTPLVVGMISAGQESGSLDRMLERVADIYENKVEAGVKGLMSALEPLLIIFVGLLIGGIMIILGLPFLNLASLF